jgi:hypothetical protein
MKNEMQFKMKSEIMKISKALKKFSLEVKLARLSNYRPKSGFRYFINSNVISSLFVTKEVLFKTTNLLRNLLSDKMQVKLNELQKSERGDVPGWVLVVLMTTGLVTGIWTVAQPRLSSILKNSLDNMNSIR